MSDKPKIPRQKVIRRLLPYVRKHLGLALVSLGCLVAMDVAGVLQPYLMKVAVDTNIAGGDLVGLGRTAAVFALVMVGAFLFEVLFNYAIQYLGQKLILDLRVDLFRKVLTLSRPFFDKTPVGDVLTNLSNDVEAIREFVAEGIVTVLGALLRVAFIFVAMLLINARLALVVFATVPLFVVATALFRIRIRGGFREVRAANSALNVSLVETISGIRELRQLGQERSSRETFDKSNRRYLTAYLKVVGAYAMFFPVMELVSSVSMALVLLFAHYAMGITVQVGEIFAFFTYVTMFFWPLRDLAEKFNTFQSAFAATERVLRLKDTPVTVIESEKLRSLGTAARGEVKLENVTFSYLKDTPVIRDVSFRVRPGEKVAIVGATGSGKSTLMSLLTRLYDVDSGLITLDGVDIRDLAFRELRTLVATVPQDAFIFTGSVADNISLGDPEIDRDQIIRAAKTVHADRFVEHLPDGYDTDVLEEGKRLSVGQRQLLGLARAVAREPRVVVLDEATSNIDSETERMIQEGIAGLLEGRTAIIIAHRLSTIRAVDRILVMKEGRLVEEGTHAQLLELGGIYAGLYEMQSLLLRASSLGG